MIWASAATHADCYAARSQARYEAARAEGFFDEELLPVDVPQGRKQPPKPVTTDEHPRPGTNVEKLAKLPLLFDGGVVTAGNASGINDGAGGADDRLKTGRRKGRDTCPGAALWLPP